MNVQLTCRLAVLCLLVVCCGGCGKAGPSDARIAQAPNGAVPAADGPIANAERKIIFSSDIDVVVDNLADAQQKMQKLIKSVEDAGGYLARQEISGHKGYHRQGYWTVRVPLSRFDGFVNDIENLGDVRRNLREAQDVTEAYADLEARLRNKQASESRLLSHLQKTGELKDTLEVERELSRVREEIERLQGQLNLLKNKTDLATIDVTISERDSMTPATAPDFASEVAKAFRTSWHGLIICGKLIVLAVAALAPWITLAAIVVIPLLVIRRLRRTRRIRTD